MPNPKQGWVLIAISALYWLALFFVSYQEIQPIYVKKKVTLSLHGQGAFTVIFSNAQPHNEVIYDMKTTWAPRFENAVASHVGKVSQEPYDVYVREQEGRIRSKYLQFATLPMLLVLLIWGIYLTVSRKRKS